MTETQRPTSSSAVTARTIVTASLFLFSAFTTVTLAATFAILFAIDNSPLGDLDDPTSLLVYTIGITALVTFFVALSRAFPILTRAEIEARNTDKEEPSE